MGDYHRAVFQSVMHVPLPAELDAMRFMATTDAWPASGQQGLVRLCELAVLDAQGETLFESIIKPGGRHELSTPLLQDELISQAPTLADVYQEVGASIEGRTVYVFDMNWTSRVLRQSRYAHGLPAIQFNLGDVKSQFRAWFKATKPSRQHRELAGMCDTIQDAVYWTELTEIAMHMQYTYPDPQRPDLPWFHWSAHYADMCRQVYLYLVACAQAKS